MYLYLNLFISDSAQLCASVKNIDTNYTNNAHQLSSKCLPILNSYNNVILKHRLIVDCLFQPRPSCLIDRFFITDLVQL